MLCTARPCFVPRILFQGIDVEACGGNSPAAAFRRRARREELVFLFGPPSSRGPPLGHLSHPAATPEPRAHGSGGLRWRAEGF